jgi:hypothetical protein
MINNEQYYSDEEIDKAIERYLAAGNDINIHFSAGLHFSLLGIGQKS